MLRRGLTFSHHLPKSTVLSRLRGRRPYANNADATALEPNPDCHRIRGRIPKKERRALLESFVQEYRAKNAGKFPPLKYTQKQVGGGFYVVRKMLQELQHTANSSPSLGQKRGSDALTVLGEDSTHEVSAGSNVTEAKTDADASDRLLEAKEEPQITSSVEILSKEVITPVRDSGLAETIIKIEEYVEVSDIRLDKLGIGMEEHKQNQFDAVQRLEVGSHSCEISENSKAKGAQADRLPYVSKEDHLSIWKTSSASPSSDDTEDTKSHLDDSECKWEETQRDRLDGVVNEKHLPIGEAHSAAPRSDDTEDGTKPHLDDSKSKAEGAQADRVPCVSKEHLSVWETISVSPLSDDTVDVIKPHLDDSKCKREETQMDRLDSVAKEKHIPIGEANRGSPCSDDTEDGTKPHLDDSKSKMGKYEEAISQTQNISKDPSSRPADDAKPSEITTFWGTMKFLANGVIRIFRN